MSNEQQPVAWWNPTKDTVSTDPTHRNNSDCVPLYTAPPQREWVGLTYYEIRDIHWSKPMNEYSYARAIEAKLKERNHEPRANTDLCDND